MPDAPDYADDLRRVLAAAHGGDLINLPAARPTVYRWAIVELKGHYQTAGLLSEETYLGQPFGRVQVPVGDTLVAQLFPGDLVYRITEVEERDARAFAAEHPPEPLGELRRDRERQRTDGGDPEVPFHVGTVPEQYPAEAAPLDRLADDGGPHAVREDDDEDDASDILF